MWLAVGGEAPNLRRLAHIGAKCTMKKKVRFHDEDRQVVFATGLVISEVRGRVEDSNPLSVTAIPHYLINLVPSSFLETL